MKYRFMNLILTNKIFVMLPHLQKYHNGQQRIDLAAITAHWTFQTVIMLVNSKGAHS
jgi:hypothetical protein